MKPYPGKTQPNMMLARGTSSHLVLKVSNAIKKLIQIGWNLVQLSIAFYGLAVSVYVLLHFIIGERWSWIALANNFVPWWALGGFVASVVALLSRRRWVLIVLQVPIILLFSVSYGSLFFAHDTSRANTSTSFTVATYNIRSSQSDPTRVSEVIMAMDADVIGIQENDVEHSAFLEQALATQYPYQVYFPQRRRGVALLSRYPILEKQRFRPGWNSMWNLRAVLDMDGVPVTIYVVHFYAPRFSVYPPSYDTQFRNIDEDILRHDYLAHENGPVLMIGDFNMSDLSDHYRVLDQDFDDAFKEAGHGLGFTFHADAFRLRLPNLIRLDYVWHNHHFVALDAKVWRNNGSSDHSPVITELALH